MKCGFVTIIGRPNVGKSTLLNMILGQKIVITTDKAQTTRKRIKGIYTDERGQIIFIDTPGVHRPLNKLGEYLLDEAKIALPDADVVLFLVDASEPAGRGDKWIAENLLKDCNINVILILKILCAPLLSPIAILSETIFETTLGIPIDESAKSKEYI